MDAVSQSSGSGGRAWSTHTVVVTTFDDSSISTTTNTTLLSSLQAYINTNMNTRSILSIPAALLQSNTNYVFTLTLCSFLGYCGRDIAPVQVTRDSTLPTIALLGAEHRIATRGTALSLSSYLQPIAIPCGTPLIEANLDYTWTIRQDSSEVHYIHCIHYTVYTTLYTL